MTGIAAAGPMNLTAMPGCERNVCAIVLDSSRSSCFPDSCVVACATHGTFAGGSTALIERSRIDQVIVTNTLPLAAHEPGGKIRQVSVAPLLAEAIVRIHRHESVSALFT